MSMLPTCSFLSSGAPKCHRSRDPNTVRIFLKNELVVWTLIVSNAINFKFQAGVLFGMT